MSDDDFATKYASLPPAERVLVNRAIDRLVGGVEPAAVRQEFNRELVLLRQREASAAPG